MSTSDFRSAAATKREILHGLAQFFVVLGRRLQTQGEAACQVAALAARAEELAAQAWKLGSGRNTADSASEFAAQLDAFSKDAATLAQQAGLEAAASQEIAAVLRDQAADLNAVEKALEGVDDVALLRSRLRPMLATLVALPARLQAMKGVATDVGGLGDRARDLAERSEALHTKKARDLGVAAFSIYRDLREFAESASVVAAQMSAESDRIGQNIKTMCSRLNQLAAPEAEEAARRAATPIGRMQTVVVQAAAEWPRAPSRATQLLRGVEWDGALNRPR